ncbi:hypothetical protein BDU57DRAFT_461629, partial [Ampelomyces quisqualis]
SDMEIMAAIGMGNLLEDERPAMTKSKRTFMQKFTERHEALKLHIRSPKLDEADHDEQPNSSRTSSSSSTHKDFFKIAPSAWTAKPERPIAMRYDDIADDTQPSPVYVNLPVLPSLEFHTESQEQKNMARVARQNRRESSVMEMNATHRLYTSHSTTSTNSSCSSPRTATRFIPPNPRLRSLPSQMSDEQMDAWLDMPEDAEAHRQRKQFATSARSDYPPTTSKRYLQRGEQAARALKVSTSPVIFRKPMFASPATSAINISIPEQEIPELDEEEGLTFAALPVEVVLRIVRHLDTKSTARCRQSCRMLHAALPAPVQPLSASKT